MLAAGAHVPRVGVLRGKPESLKRGVSHSARRLDVGVAVAARAHPAVLLGPRERRPDRHRQRLALAGVVEGDEVAQPTARPRAGPAADLLHLAAGAVLADGVDGPVLVGEAGRQRQGVDPRRQPVLGRRGVEKLTATRLLPHTSPTVPDSRRRRRGRCRRRGCAAGRVRSSSARLTSGRTTPTISSRTPAPSGPGGSRPVTLSASPTAMASAPPSTCEARWSPTAHFSRPSRVIGMASLTSSTS